MSGNDMVERVREIIDALGDIPGHFQGDIWVAKQVVKAQNAGVRFIDNPSLQNERDLGIPGTGNSGDSIFI